MGEDDVENARNDFEIVEVCYLLNSLNMARSVMSWLTTKMIFNSKEQFYSIVQ
jgi:hypothetical protein